ncbi:MAG: peptide MFS transporter [Acidobacteriaceae bacterium]|jgi:POT family proton-dependent oligopeptide transporter|nr:peptide MFS transporter [Acidobacteriaceae bacterium]
MRQTDTEFFGHPRGLSTLFFTEMWERFSYYGMRAFLILYMTAPASSGGLGFADASAASIYGTYTGSVWGASILGGLVADRVLGQYRSVLIGGLIIALGHFTLAFHSLSFFYAGLALIVVGTGLLKPNVSTLVGSLYASGDTRRDAGFSLFYMGINLGAFIGPLIAGYLAQRVDWHIGFASAGVGMVFGLVQYVLGKQRLQPALTRLAEAPHAAATTTATADASTSAATGGFTATEWKRLGAIVIFFLIASLFWGAYEQAGSTLNLFADRYTRLELFGLPFPSSWLQSVQAVFVILFAPIFAWVWKRLGSHEPSVPAKFAIGVLAMGLGFLLLVPAGHFAQSGDGIRVSPWWLITVYAISEIGELCVSPVGLSVVTKLSPVRIVGVMMGVWFLSNALGNKLAGWAASFFSTVPLRDLFMDVAVVLVVAAAVMFALVRPVKRLMGGVQ